MSRFPNKKLLYTSSDEMMAQHLCALLAASGFECEIKNTTISDIAVPRIIAPTEIWVDESTYEEASVELRKALSENNNDSSPWTCKGCNQRLEGQFAQCWNCGKAKT